MNTNIYYPEIIENFNPTPTQLSNTDFSVVYLTEYTGDKLPRYYIGSTYYKHFVNGYVGSVCSKKYESIFKDELRNNKHLFICKIISIHDTRKEALDYEYKLHLQYNVVKSEFYMNMANASPDGCFGTGSAIGHTHARDRIWVNNGLDSKMVYPDKIPEGYFLGRLASHAEHMSDSIKGKPRSWRWVTKEGTTESKRISKTDKLPEGYVEGRGAMQECTKNRVLKPYKWYYNPATLTELRVYENTLIPEGYIKGRCKGAYCINKKKAP